MNKVTLIGRLTRDPEIRNSQGQDGNNIIIARYSLAVNRRFKNDNQPDADFINCVAMGKNGEFAEKYLKKGMKIAINGEWRTGSYTNKDGNKVYTNDCFVNEHEFVESKAASDQNGTSSPSPATVQTNDGFMTIPDGVEDEGLPFN